MNDLQDLVVNVSGDRPVYLKDVAEIIDGPAEVESYSWIGFGPADESQSTSDRVSIRPCTSRWPNAKGPMPLGGQRGRAAMEELAETHFPDGIALPHHPRLRRDGQREGQRTGRRAGRRRADGRRADRPGDRLATGSGDRPGHSGLLQPDAVRQSAGRLHDQPGDHVRADPVAGAAGRRSDHRRGEHRPLLRHAVLAAAPVGAQGGPGSAAGLDPLDAGDHRQLPAAGVHHRHDGALHGSDGPERAADGDHLDGRGLHSSRPGWRWWRCEDVIEQGGEERRST